MAAASDDGKSGLSLVSQLSRILDSDPFIDDLGFIHPTQLKSLQEMDVESVISFPEHGKMNENAVPAVGNSVYGEGHDMFYDRSAFWCANHKLAIVVSVLPSLYQCAKAAFLETRHEYDHFMKLEMTHCHTSLYNSVIQSEYLYGETLLCLRNRLMTYTRVLVIINCDYKSAWNVRKEMLASTTEATLSAELRLCNLALSHCPKSEEPWEHRRWVISQIMNYFSRGKMPKDVLQGELKHVEFIAEKSKMNYRSWHHCSWLVQYMPLSQCLFEHLFNMISKESYDSQTCGEDRAAENQRICSHDTLQVMELWEDEIKWNEDLINFYRIREALWMHRRFLFYMWIRHIKPNVSFGSCAANFENGTDLKQTTPDRDNCPGDYCHFIAKEMELVDNFFSMSSSNHVEDANRQQILAATYKLWILLMLTKTQNCNSTESEICKKELVHVEGLLKVFGSERENLWDGLFKAFKVGCHSAVY
eukprot:c21031_g1_i2 orf=571-1995(-)